MMRLERAWFYTSLCCIRFMASLKYVNHYGKCFSIPSLNDINHVHAVHYSLDPPLWIIYVLFMKPFNPFFMQSHVFVCMGRKCVMHNKYRSAVNHLIIIADGCTRNYIFKTDMVKRLCNNIFKRSIF